MSLILLLMFSVDTLFLNEHAELKKRFKLKRTSLKNWLNHHCPSYYFLMSMHRLTNGLDWKRLVWRPSWITIVPNTLINFFIKITNDKYEDLVKWILSLTLFLNEQTQLKKRFQLKKTSVKWQLKWQPC